MNSIPLYGSRLQSSMPMHSSLGLPDTVTPQSDSGASVRRLLAYGKKCRPYYSLIGRKSSRKKVKKTKKQKKWNLDDRSATQTQLVKRRLRRMPCSQRRDAVVPPQGQPFGCGQGRAEVLKQNLNERHSFWMLFALEIANTASYSNRCSRLMSP